MRVITPLDLRRSLGAILDEASAGGRFLIERDHRPMAILVSVEDGRRLDDDPEVRRARALEAIDRLAAFGAEMRERYPGGPSALDTIRAERGRDDRA
jgi:antitoxin (DNA-binding transcriptional repressor) of toxin-antitoxin stability system